MLQNVKNTYIFPEIGEFYLLVIITKHAKKQKLKNTLVHGYTKALE